VEVETDKLDSSKGQILSLVPRKNSFVRWNVKRKCPQLLAANLDFIVLATTPDEPPFRPRFIDRELAQAECQNLEPIIVCNKCDLSAGDDIDFQARTKIWEDLGYAVLYVSAKTGAGLDALARFLSGRVAAFVGQSGVGPDVPVGITIPAPIVRGTVVFMANLDKSWKGVNVDELMTRVLERPSHALNDADAAGLAEVVYGAAKGVPGTIIVTTLGTGIGSAVIVDGTLVPNTELGHLEIDGHDAESRASSHQREIHDMSWKKWAKRLQRYYGHVEMLFSPDLFVVGGGVSRKHEKFLPLLDLRTPIVPARLLNTAGIVGAAYEAARTAR